MLQTTSAEPACGYLTLPSWQESWAVPADHAQQACSSLSPTQLGQAAQALPPALQDSYLPISRLPTPARLLEVGSCRTVILPDPRQPLTYSPSPGLRLA